MNSLKYKILLLTLIPLSLVLFTIGILSVHNKNINERDLLLERLNSYHYLLESGDLTFETSADKDKLKALLGETIEFSEIISRDYSVIYSSENSAVPLITAEEKLDIDEAFYGTKTIKNNFVDANGKSMLVVISPLVVNDRVVAVIHQGISNEDSSLRVREYGFFVLVLTLSGMLICFILIFILLNIVVLKNIFKLKNSALEIQKGNLNIKNDIVSNDEIGQLATVFNDMTSKLEESYSSLENKIQERTKELDLKVKEITDNNLELENNKIVILNLLEDFEKEKSNAEKLVVIRTQELSDEKSRLIASINSLKIGFAIVGTEGEFIVNNPSLIHILDIKEETIALDDITRYLKVEGESLLERLKRCTKDKCIVEINEIMFNKKYLRLFLNPVFSLEGVPIGGVLLLEDITEEKVLERSRDEFFAVASHELRTPLTAIRGNSEMMLESYKEEIKNKDIKEMLTDIHDASVRLIGIVNDFLEVSRLEQGNITFDKKLFDVIELTEKVISSLKTEADKKNISLEIAKPENPLPKVFADESRISQVLFNLIGNSLKFTEKGSIRTTFELIDNNIKIRVVDTGKGISIKNESLLFRKFQPAGDDVLARDVAKSTGLGLYISKMLVDKMGGTIGLEKTEAGIGSVFFFTIPTSS